MLLEVIAKDLKDIQTINNSKANRIEFCRELKVGGLTPKEKDIVEACQISKLPVNVIVRNTDRDFIYSDEEKEEMLEQVKFIAKTKANGIVIGALTKDLKVDVEFIKKVNEIKKDLEITFHKAFDEVCDFKEAYSTLNDLGITNVLTSGGKDIEKGIDVLKELIGMNLETKVLVGGGVNQNNFNQIKSISNDIHVGSCVRQDMSWDKWAKAEEINKLLEN
ncbi:copper homeostasis protein CutC [Spiroplasma sp. BIUS-1]|uniref:copper homeostasis protein CutC n=1 Tax=Spiroplasma sp. BIUS-1 TaxID=216964 RepID=UPI0013978337|nr:copper homeostasis protein CutC [Spiroplasma sp. BIUS-1]QHX36895.1 copper homeostasis protein [Spiroplasma sp. BIUS-1]